MEIRAPLVMSSFIVAAMLAASAWAWALIPDSAVIAIHWNAAGEPNGFAHKPFALLAAPAFAAGLTAFFAVAPFLTKRRANMAKSFAAYVVGWLGVLLAIAVAHFVMIMHARGLGVNVVGSSTFLMALFLVALGNLLGKTYPNPYVGVRTPWTRKSDYSWEKTHRAAGKMVVALGLCTLGAMAVADTFLAQRVLFFGMLASAVVATFLSYVYYRRDPARRSGEVR